MPLPVCDFEEMIVWNHPPEHLQTKMLREAASMVSNAVKRIQKEKQAQLLKIQEDREYKEEQKRLCKLDMVDRILRKQSG